jgi:hypothetical protein
MAHRNGSWNNLLQIGPAIEGSDPQESGRSDDRISSFNARIVPQKR